MLFTCRSNCIIYTKNMLINMYFIYYKDQILFFKFHFVLSFNCFTFHIYNLISCGSTATATRSITTIKVKIKHATLSFDS